MIELAKYENQVYSQQGEDGVINKILKEIDTTNKVAVEFGALDALTDNTFLLKRCGWKVYQINSEQLTPNIHKAFITAENINQVFSDLGVPQEFDVLSIDIDYNDYWVWKALTYSPRLVVIEHNASIPPDEARTVPYDPKAGWDGTNYFGASLLALERLGKEKDYSLVYVESMGVNAFFVRNDCLGQLTPLTAKEAYQKPKYGPNDGGHPQSDKTMPLL